MILKAALTLPGGGHFPLQQKAHDMGVTRLGWCTNDPVIDPATNGGVQVLEPVRGNGFTLFLMRALWGWTAGPIAWADMFFHDMERFDMLAVKAGPNQHTARQCALNADLEVDDADWVAAALTRLLSMMPGRGLTWSMQPHKGGIINDKLRALINLDARVSVAPYLYRNNMQRCSERWVVEDLVDNGILEAKIHPYYRDNCEGWDGILWDLAQIS